MQTLTSNLPKKTNIQHIQDIIIFHCIIKLIKADLAWFEIAENLYHNLLYIQSYDYDEFEDIIIVLKNSSKKIVFKKQDFLVYMIL